MRNLINIWENCGMIMDNYRVTITTNPKFEVYEIGYSPKKEMGLYVYDPPFLFVGVLSGHMKLAYGVWSSIPWPLQIAGTS
jgi:hypothetical protein